jgi:putative FmdB family regulatory protein
MPLYEYQCQACLVRFERIRKFSDPPIEVCPNCGKGPVEKLVSSPAFQFKGTGWYVTDYSRKGESASKKEESGASTKDSPKSDTSSTSSSPSTEAAKPAEAKPSTAKSE